MMRLYQLILVIILPIQESLILLNLTKHHIPFKFSQLLAVKKQHKVTIRHKSFEKTLSIDDDTDILSALLDNGIDIAHDCKVGSCLMCPSQIISGIVDQSKGNFDETVTGHGFALTCISYARSDLILQSLDSDDRETPKFHSYIDSVYDSWKKK